MKVSLIIPTLGERNLNLKRLLDSLVIQDYQNIEVIIISQDHYNKTQAICEKYLNNFLIKHIFSKHKGLSLARNEGLSYVSGDLVILSDDDCWYPQGAITKIVSIFQNNSSIDILLTQIYDPVSSEYYKKYIQIARKITSVFQLLSCSSIELAFKTDAYIGMFDERFGLGAKFNSGEETNFLIDNFRAGKNIYYAPVVTVYHAKKRQITTNDKVVAKGAFYFRNFTPLVSIAILLRDIIIKHENNFIHFWHGYRQIRKEEIKEQTNVCCYKELLKLAYTAPRSFWNNIGIKRNKNNEKKVFLLGTPVHGNLGDHIIAVAEIEFLRRLGLDPVELSMPYCNVFFKHLIKLIQPQDLILISGGGWLGSLWKYNEMFVRKVITTFKRNYIMILPQTVSYEDGDVEFLESGKRVYRLHPNLYCYTREMNSFTFIKKHKFLSKDDNVKLVPDMALAFNWTNKKLPRHSIGVCLRTDKEKSMSSELQNQIETYLYQNQYDYTLISTVLDKWIRTKDRRKFLDEKLDEFSTKKLIITDRLHAMIFAVITGTPCIAFDNATHKVSGVYKTLGDIEYVSFANSFDSFESAFKNFTMTDYTETICNTSSLFLDKYKELANLIVRVYNDERH